MIGQEDFSTITVMDDLWDNPHMPEPKEILRQRIGLLLERSGKSKLSVSREIGANDGYIRDLLDPAKSSMPSAARLEKIAAALETTTDYLLAKVENDAQPVSEVEFREIMVAPNRQMPGIPLIGIGYCDDLTVESDDGTFDVERVQLEMDVVVRMLERPPALSKALDAYSIYFHGSSMEPVFEQGDVGVVDPRRPPSPGDYVVAQINDGSNADVMTVLVKRLVRMTREFYEYEQFNPPMSFRVPRHQVTRMHRILRMAEVLGA